jgi:Mg/Co/Ni transporter MgtE
MEETEQRLSQVEELIGAQRWQDLRDQLAELPVPDDRTEFFEDLPGIAIQRLLNLLSPGELLEARKLLGYPRESVGRLMTPDYVALRENWTTETALAHIRRVGRESETINSVFVIDDRWHLLDDIQLLKGGVEIAFVIAASMFAVVFVTNLIGVVIPLTLTKLGIDPAVASNPLISSIADVSCLLIYFSIARAVLL